MIGLGSLNRLLSEYHKSKSDLLGKYLEFSKDLQAEENKYYFPVVMGICTFDEIRKMTYDDVCHITNIARLKLEKQHFEIMLNYGI